MQVVLGPAAESELSDATDWYASVSPELGRRFFAEYRRARGLIEEAPERWAMLGSGVRRVMLSGFPYSLIYRIEGGMALIVAVKHHRRDPNYWKNRH